MKLRIPWNVLFICICYSDLLVMPYFMIWIEIDLEHFTHCQCRTLIQHSMLRICRYDLEVGIHSPPVPDVQAGVSVQVERIPRHDALYATPVDISATAAQLLDTTQVNWSHCCEMKTILCLSIYLISLWRFWSTLDWRNYMLMVFLFQSLMSILSLIKIALK